MADYRVMACAPVWVGDRETGIAQTKWFPALVGNHVADIVKHHGAGTDLVPESLTAYIARREGFGADEGYDYHEHTALESDNSAYVTPEITEDFCVIGPAEAHRREDSGAGGRRRHPVQHLPRERRRGADRRRLRRPRDPALSVGASACRNCGPPTPQ